MDIEYLLFLQNIRLATGGTFDEFFNAISKVAVDVMPFLPFVVFWCVSKKWGYRYLLTLGVGEIVNGLIKLTVCAYRPWIRSELIEPAGDSKTAATGYSFPSGHTSSATDTYGTTFVWQKDKRRWIAVICAVMIVLTGFSRNYLGVHTPQDVLVGFIENVIIIILVGMAMEKLEGNEKIKDVLTALGIAAIVLAIIYITKKPYPMDYVDGALLVDPEKMMNDCFKSCGALIGLMVGSYIDRHYLHYEIPEGSKNLPILGFVGFIIAFSWKEYFAPATLVAAFGGHWGHFISRFILWMFAVVIWPLCIKKLAYDQGMPEKEGAK